MAHRPLRLLDITIVQYYISLVILYGGFVGASKLTTKYQATIPKDVRQKLGLKTGDVVVFKIAGDTVMVEKASPIDKEFARYVSDTLSEWDSDEDEEAFRDLQKV